ncbi:MAG: SNF2 helicase associated domain-containing protein [Clostridiaceae bacterium]|nr:SNF2 helicase associated domain-containing protein [Clostridiaceae bacterium]
MLKQDKLLQIFNEEISGKNHAKGQRVFNNDLVSLLEINSEDYLIYIRGNVISENLFNEYITKIDMDLGTKSILSTYCSCLDYTENEFEKRNYCCKHLVASFYKALGELAAHPLLGDEQYSKEANYKNKGKLLSILLGDEKDKDEIKIEVYINKSKWDHSLTAEFKIGLNSMSSNNLYILKDINQFLVSLDNNVPVSYSKNFCFDIKNQRLSVKDKRLIDFMKTLQDMEETHKYSGRKEERLLEGKNIKIPENLVRLFFEVISKHRIYLNEGFFSRPVDTEILMQVPIIEFDLKIIKEDYVLKSPTGMPMVLGSKNDVFLYGTLIYLPAYEFCYKISPYLRIFNEAKVVTIPCAEEEKVLKRLIPELKLLSANITLSKIIKDKIVMGECCFSFYFNKQDQDITLTVKVKYGTFEFNILEEYEEKVIYRDRAKEGGLLSTLKSLCFEELKGKFYLRGEEAYIFKFFKGEIKRLQEIGEVYYSENFKGLKSIGSKGILGDIKPGRCNYFDLNFKIADISSEETAAILRAFKDNFKYYKLKNGEYLDLEELELNKFLKLLDVMSSKDVLGNHIEIAKNKGAFLESYLEDNQIRYIKGKTKLKEIRDKLKDIEKLKFKGPKDLQGNLREYQKIGYNWFKTLDYLGFGGILGDEMGLGKTLQTITFLLAQKGSKSLIVVPTSLIYNWMSEFEKFAPTIRVAIGTGSKDERQEIISNIEKSDVILTTYNLLKRDLDSYKTIEFNYCILDEAQYIKNPNSQNALSVKEIKANTRFALSGTPIENSLMELWSIFDFIMPGYLYDEKRFSVRYHKKLKEEPEIIQELNRLIKPFILRRKKKDVIKELPDKIERTLLVTFEEEQKKVYKAYANYAVELIEKKVKDEEFKNSKIEIFSYISKLRQLCLDPSVVMDDYKGSSSKIEALVELLLESIEEGHKILVFSQFTTVLKNIGKRIIAQGISFSYLDGSIASEKRMGIVNDFNAGANPVFLISLKAGGTGLNLTSADIVIHFDPWWNPAVEEQATDRAHRIGQKKVLEVIKIIAKGTIEENILILQKEKKKLISALMGDELSSGDSFKTFTEDEILGLFK